MLLLKCLKRELNLFAGYTLQGDIYYKIYSVTSHDLLLML